MPLKTGCHAKILRAAAFSGGFGGVFSWQTIRPFSRGHANGEITYRDIAVKMSCQELLDS